MNTSGLASIPSSLLMAVLVGPSTLLAQEIVEVTGRDQRIDADFEEIFRVGALERESWETLGTVRKVAFDASGNLYVFDGAGGVRGPWLDPRVLVFDAAGNFVREFGRSGEGPGEFNAPMTMAVMGDGTTVVSDMGHRAYQVFDNSGTFERMVRAGVNALQTVFATAMNVDPRGRGVFFTPPTGAPASAGPGPSPPVSRPIIRVGLDADVAQVDTVAHGWLPTPPDNADAEVPGLVVNGRSVTLRDLGRGQTRIFQPEIHMGVLSDGRVVFSDSSAYALKIAEPSTRSVVFVITRPFDPQPVTAAIEAAEIARREARGLGGQRMVQIRGRDGGTQSASYELPEPVFYPELPVIHALLTTWEGRIWVQRRGEDPHSGGAIDVLTPEGGYIGTYSTGATAMPEAFGPDGLAAFIELDEFDVASVVVRRLPTEVR